MWNKKFIALAAVCLSQMFVPAGSSYAQDATVKEEQGQAAKYMNGGVGDGQARYMQSVAKNWPLRIMFSQLKANEFIADVNLQITNSKKANMLQLEGAGPLTYVQLPAGTYRVTASHEGQTQTRNVTLGKNKSSDIHFHWKGSAKDDPFDGKPLRGSQVPG